MAQSVVGEKAFRYEIRIVNLYQHLTKVKKEFVISKQLLRSGTCIGANAAEAAEGQSRRDFINKMSIALKEARETEYWLKLIAETKFITRKEFESIFADCTERVKMITAIIKTAKTNYKTKIG